jgi:uncharacterized repeat protein (TIGR01451 family)
MERERQQIMIILFVVLAFLLTGCGHHCCAVLEGPTAEWPAPIIAKAEKPMTKPKVEQPKPGTKKKVESVETKESKPETKPEAVEPGEEELPPKAPAEKVTPKPTETKEAEPKKTEEPKPPTEPKEPLDTEIKEKEAKVILESSMQGEPVGMVQSPYTVKCVITNKGNKLADNYQLKTVLPEGLKYEDKSLEPTKIHKFEKLEPTKDKLHEFKLLAEQPGNYTIQAEVLLDNAVVHKSTLPVEMKKAELTVALDGPKEVNMEIHFEYTMTVKNSGQVSLADITLQDKFQEKLPDKKVAGFIYISSSPEGVYTEEKGWVTWKVGDLNPGQDKAFKLKLTGIEKGSFLNRVRAKDAKNLTIARAEIETKVGGTIGLQVNHYDTTNPVEVGDKTTYVVEVSNQGQKDATNVQLVDTFPIEATLVDVPTPEGTDIPLTHKVEGNKIIFDPIDILKPGAKVIFRITVKPTKPGDLVNTATIQSSDFGQPITKQVGTKAVSK